MPDERMDVSAKDVFSLFSMRYEEEDKDEDEQRNKHEEYWEYLGD